MKVGRATKSKEADYAIERVRDMVKVIPEIWLSEGEDNQRNISHARTDQMDSILAPTPVGA